MKAKFLQQDGVVDYTPSADTAAGEVVVTNGRLGIALMFIASGAIGALGTKGIFEVVKANGSINDGAAVYWDADGNPQGGEAGTGCATTTSSGNTFMGYAVGGVGATDEQVIVDLFPGQAGAVTVKSVFDNPITDPGNTTKAIPVTASGYVALVTAGAETRTLAAPSFIGQELMIYMKTDGGNGVITVAGGVNQTGNNTLTFDDAGDSIRLVAIESGSNKVWRVVSNDGVTLTTV